MCPPCFYKLQGEPPLEHSFHCEMDGNNSAKRSDALIRQKEELPDSRRLSSDRWLSREEVDRFKDEVRTRTVQSVSSTLEEFCSVLILFCRDGQQNMVMMTNSVLIGRLSLRMIPLQYVSRGGKMQARNSENECSACFLRLVSSLLLAVMGLCFLYVTWLEVENCESPLFH